VAPLSPCSAASRIRSRAMVASTPSVNDLHGHSHGDQILSTLATILRSQRLEDRPFRLGGDEFALILPFTDGVEATIALERMREAAEQGLSGATVSVGIAAIGGETDAADGIREQADAALYEAKRRGRNTVVSFDEIRSSTSIVSTATIMAVRRILANRSIRIVFQPIWHTAGNTLLGHEALMRPEGEEEITEPQEAFAIAEKLGRAAELDALCRELILARASEIPADTLLFINVSPHSLDHSHLAGDELLTRITAAGLTPNQVVFEITERSIARLDLVVRQATRLRELGFRLALDDVGAGNAGLEMLRSVPVDFVKIDHSVIVEAMTDNSAFAVLTGIVAFARRAKTYIIAEGIETPEMLAIVRAASVPEGGSGEELQGAQGFLLGRPSESPILAPRVIKATEFA
jgi:EAL domain-containing protein (putative c-di-GMP-specific phosphodiesterase class I)